MLSHDSFKIPKGPPYYGPPQEELSLSVNYPEKNSLKALLQNTRPRKPLTNGPEQTSRTSYDHRTFKT
jgi:hypothetical protein